MISFWNSNDQLVQNNNTLCVSYTRKINIIYNHYPHLDIIHNMIVEIKNNLNKDMENYTNVKGGMTDWNYFIDKKLFTDFLINLINKHRPTNPDMFQFFLEKYIVSDAWGNEIKKGDSLDFHTHDCFHGILYLTEGCDLILPELNIKLTPKPGDYYIFPPEILHGFEKYQGEQNRYSLIFNIRQNKDRFDFNKKLEKLEKKIKI